MRVGVSVGVSLGVIKGNKNINLAAYRLSSQEFGVERFVCVCTRAHAARARVCVRVRECECVVCFVLCCVHNCVCVCIIYIHYIHTHIHTYIYIHACMHAYIRNVPTGLRRSVIGVRSRRKRTIVFLYSVYSCVLVFYQVEEYKCGYARRSE